LEFPISEGVGEVVMDTGDGLVDSSSILSRKRTRKAGSIREVNDRLSNVFWISDSQRDAHSKLYMDAVEVRSL